MLLDAAAVFSAEAEDDFLAIGFLQISVSVKDNVTESIAQMFSASREK
jgi:hypothetical protein